MRRILLITENLGSGGAERQLCGLAAMLKESGYECRVVTYLENQYFQPYLEQHGVDYEFVPSLACKYTRVARLVKYLREYKPDVVISFLTHVNVYLCLARIFYKCKLIVSERNNNTAYTLADRLHFALYRMADYVVPNSNCQAEFIKKHCPSLSKKVVTICNFVDTDLFVPAERTQGRHTIKILTIARYAEQKNCLRYLMAVKKVKDMCLPVRFEWYGNNNAEKGYYEKVVQKAVELGIQDVITLNDQVSDVVSLYQNADVFCLPSFYEGYPNTVVEAMSCGLPVICSDVCENPRIITDVENGFLFNPSDADQIAEVVARAVICSEEQRRKIGHKNRKKCNRNNSCNVFLQNYIELVNR